MSNARPHLEGLFNGSATVQPGPTWLNGKPDEPERPAADTPTAELPPAPRQPAAPRPAAPPPPAAPAAAEPVGLFDPVALAERYFAMMQALLDLQRDFGLRLAHQVAELPRMNRLRR